MNTTTITSRLRAGGRRAAHTAVLAMLAALCALTVTLAAAPAAHAGIVYSRKGSFRVDRGSGYPLGMAVQQSNEHVYIADFFEGVFQVDSSGNPLPPEPFADVDFLPTGVAVDPVNQNVYAFDFTNDELDTFEPSGAKLRDFTTGGRYSMVQIASNAAGDIFYPNQEAKTVEEFEPDAEGTAPAPILTIAPTGPQELLEPKGVAVDSVNGKVYVVDSGNTSATPPGRVQVFNASSGAYESTLNEAGAQDVAVDPVNGDVFVLDLNSEGDCAPRFAPCYRVLAYHYGETTPFIEFGAGTIGTGSYPDHIAVDHKSGEVYVSEGEDGGNVWIFQAIVAPIVSTEAATGVNGSEATLHGMVNPEGNQTSYDFEYGTSTAYGKSVPVPEAALGAGNNAIPVSQPLSGLEGSATYHFRVVANAGGGIVIDGADETFTTSAASPAIAGESVSGIKRGDARLEALVNPENQETTYHFEYATNPQLTGATTLGSASIPPEGQSVPVSHDICGGLTPGVTYYYRVVAENATLPPTDGPVQSFITIGKPVVDTGETIGLTRTSATVQGTIDPVGAESAYHYAYIDQAGYEAAVAEGASDPYADGQSTPAVKVVAGYATEAVGPVSIGGLLAGETYHYALIADNEVGEAIGHDETFTTGSPTKPLVSTGTASAVSINAAIISATIETGGLPAIYGFEIGTEAGVYGVATGLGSVGAGLTETVTLSLQGLLPGTTYHYRIEASNVDGVAYGADESFTTPGLPVLLTSLIAEPLIASPAIAFPTGSQANTGSAGETKPLTKAQKLKAALKVCRKQDKHNKGKRQSCEKTAHKKFGPVKAKKKK